MNEVWFVFLMDKEGRCTSAINENCIEVLEESCFKDGCTDLYVSGEDVPRVVRGTVEEVARLISNGDTLTVEQRGKFEFGEFLQDD